MRITLSLSDPNIEYKNDYDTFVDVYYKGEPFSGILKGALTTIHYKNGNAHGNYTAYYKEGGIQTQQTLENGTVVFSQRFYKNGQLKAKLANGLLQRWHSDGVLIQKGNEHYFKNGALRMLYGDKNDDFKIKYFSPNGEWLYTQVKDVLTENKTYERVVTYNHELLQQWFPTLLNEVVRNDLSEKNRIHHVWMWIWELFKHNPIEYFKTLNKLLEHPNKTILEKVAKIIAYHKFHPYIQKENKNNQKAYQLINEYTANYDKRNPKRICRKVEL